MTTRPIFKDPELESAFRKFGYVLAPMASPEQVAALRQLNREYVHDSDGQFHATVQKADIEVRREIKAKINAIIGESFSAYLNDCRNTLFHFLDKSANTTHARIPIHQDPNGVDPNDEPNIVLWMPLIDVDETNGCLTAYPGTHLMGPFIVTFPQSDSPYAEVDDLLKAEYGVKVPMKAGQALIYDGRLLHSSEDNHSNQRRPVVAGSYLPIEHTPTLFIRADRQSDVVEVFSVDELAKIQIAGAHCSFVGTDGIQLLRTIPLPTYPKVTPADLEHLRPLVEAARAQVG